LTRLISPFGLQWIRGCEAVDTIQGFTSYKLFELVRNGLSPHNESLDPILPTRVAKMRIELAMWEEWLKAEDEDHRSTILTRPPHLYWNVKQLAKGCDYKLSDDNPPIPVPQHSIPLPDFGHSMLQSSETPSSEKIREGHRDEAKRNTAYLIEEIAKYGPNSWAAIVFDLAEEEVESLRLLGAYYKYVDLMARLQHEPSEITAQATPETKEEVRSRKYTALTSAGKRQLEIIKPKVIDFCEKLKARIQDECETLANAGDDDWKTQALSLLEDNETIIEADIQKISFPKLAKSDHKERLKPELAQIILERKEGLRVSRKALGKFFK
jgi:hypothetical protein